MRTSGGVFGIDCIYLLSAIGKLKETMKKVICIKIKNASVAFLSSRGDFFYLFHLL